MARRLDRGARAALVIGVSFALGACGKSERSLTGALNAPQPQGMAANAGAGSCLVGDTVYRSGESFGDCQQCTCMNGSTQCGTLILCPAEDNGGGGNGAAGGGAVAGRAAGGRAGSDVSEAGGAGADCLAGDVLHAYGSHWDVDCNTCYCVAAGVACTMAECAPSGAAGAHAGSSAGGASSGGATSSQGGALGATGGRAGAAAAGAGAAGAPPRCDEAKVGSFCVLGTPADDGKVDLVAGMPLAVSLQTTGCDVHRCSNDSVSVSCHNVLGSEGAYWISPEVCFGSDGELCTDEQCGGVADVSCETGITLEARSYKVSLGGSAVSVKFTVPSHVAAADLCL